MVWLGPVRDLRAGEQLQTAHQPSAYCKCEAAAALQALQDRTPAGRLFSAPLLALVLGIAGALRRSCHQLPRHSESHCAGLQPPGLA